MHLDKGRDSPYCTDEDDDDDDDDRLTQTQTNEGDSRVHYYH